LSCNGHNFSMLALAFLFTGLPKRTACTFILTVQRVVTCGLHRSIVAMPCL
jgi:hypothetical protein